MRFTRGPVAAMLTACLVATALAPAAGAASDPAPPTDGTSTSGEELRKEQERKKEHAEVAAPFQPVTGVRRGATTILGGAVLNQTDRPADVTIRLSDLPEGTRIAAVRPDPTHPDPDDAGGTYAWRCEDLTCRLTGADGQGRELPPDGSVRAVLALEGDRLAPGDEATITVGDGRPHAVPLDRPDRQPPLGKESLSAAIAGPDRVAPGETVELTATIGNAGTSATAPGTLAVEVPVPPVEGTVVTAGGEGWNCLPSRCTSTATVEPLDAAPPLTITVAAAPAAEGTGRLRVGATATSVDGTELRTDATRELTVAAPITHDVSVRFGRLPQASLSVPATQDVPVIVTPTGHSRNGTILHEAVTVTLETEAHVTVDWDRAGRGGPWSCSVERERCTSTGPLPAGTATVLSIPVTYEHGAAEGLSKLRARATVEGDAEATDTATTTVVVNPPPVPELRARMTAASGTGTLPGSALVFEVGAPRPVRVQVTNHGSRPAREGSKVEVSLSPDVEQTVVRAGGDGWRCRGFTGSGERAEGRGPLRIGKDGRLRCRTTLAVELASEATIALPLTLAPTGSGSSRWTVETSLDGREVAGKAPEFRVDVETDTPRLVPHLQVDHGLVRGGVGSVQITLDNGGLAPADGGVLVVDLPTGVAASKAAGEGWTCPATALAGARGNLTCVTTATVAPGEATTPLRIELTTATSVRGDEVEVWLWGTAPGQEHPTDARAGSTVRLRVHPEEAVDAGDDLTVVTPVLGPDGQLHPAIVLLRGEVSGSLARHVRWEQRCTTEGEEGCDAVEPAVTWLGVPPGAQPTTAVARFAAPTITAPTTLTFRLTGSNGVHERHSDVEVHLVPASSAALGSPVGRSGGSATAVPAIPSGTGPSAPTELSVAMGDGSVLQVPTRGEALLTATATGTGPFTWSWRQTSGADADVIGATDGPDLAFVAPSLEPDQTSEELEFAVTVTDALGESATATAAVQVVWGDDGLQVTVADGAPAVVAHVGGPVSITSQVTSAGAPYTYKWSLVGGNAALPSGTTTNAPTLSFTAPKQPVETTVQLEVTDSFGRVTVASVPLDVTELDPNKAPAAMCQALADLSAGTPAELRNADGSVVVTIPSGTVSGSTTPPPSTTTTSTTTTATTTTTTPASTTTTTPTPTCPTTASATFDDATATLPGGVTVTGASGELSITGVTLAAGTVAIPAAWGPVTLEVPSSGFLVPFVTDRYVGLPLGSLQGDGVPFVGLPGWQTTTTVTFPAGGAPHAAIDAAATTGSGTTLGRVSMTGSSTGSGATKVQITATGLAGVGPVDVPLKGELTTAAADGPVVASVEGAVAGPAPLASDVGVRDVRLAWTPSAQGGTSTGVATLLLGVGRPLEVTADVSDSSPAGPTSLSVHALPWAPGGAAGPQLTLGGTGTVSRGSTAHLQLHLAGPAAGPWAPGSSLLVTDLTPSVGADCDLSPTTACGPTGSLSGSIAVGAPVGDGTVHPLAGKFDPATSTTTLTADTGTVTLAPLTVTGTTLTSVLTPADSTSPGAAVTTAAGTSSVLAVDRPTTVTYDAVAVVAAASLAGDQPIPGWTLQGTVAVATTALTTYQVGTGASAVSAPVVPGVLTGVATTTMPTALSKGVLPSSVTSGALTFPIAAGPSPAPPTAFQLHVGTPEGWDLLGAGGAYALTVDSVTWSILVHGGTVTVSALGTGTITVPSLPGASGGAAPPLAFTGTLAAGAEGGVLALTYSSAQGASWPSPFGVAGLSLPTTSVSATVTPAGTTATLTGDALLTGSLAAVLGTSSTTTVPLSAPLAPGGADSGVACPTVDLSGIGIDVGGLGLLLSPTASLVLAPGACTNAGTSVDPGLWATFSAQYLGSGTLPIEPATSAIDDDLELPDAQIGGLVLDGTTIAIRTSGPASSPQVAMTVSGSASVAGQTLQLSGPVTPPTASSAVGSITLTSAGDDRITLPGSTGSAGDSGDLTVATEGLIVQVPALAGPGTPDIVIAGTTEVLGDQDVGIWLEGTADGSAITSLSGCITGVGGTPPTPTTPDPCTTPPVVTFPMPVAGDTLSAPITIDYDATKSGQLDVASPSGTATLVADGFTFDDSTITLTNTGFDIESAMVVPGSSLLPVALGGDYLVDPTDGDGRAGDYTIETESSTPLSFSGFSATGDVVFSRSQGTANATISVELTPGLFDHDTSVALSGQIQPDGTSTLTGTADDVTLRGLSGDATFTVTPAVQSTDSFAHQLGLQGWYEVDVSLATVPGECDMWSGAPDLSGTIYRSGTVTYYTLTGTTQVWLPEPVDVEEDGQPIVLSNEWLGMSGQPATGLTLTKSFHTAAFQATGQISLQPAQCSYGVSGSLLFTFTQGSNADQLHSAVVPPTGLAYQSGGFGPGGTIPQDIEVVRAALELDALRSQLATAQAQAQARANQASDAVTEASGALADAKAALQEANTRLATAQQELAAAEEALERSAGAMSTALEQQDQEAFFAAKQALATAEADYLAASTGAEAAQQVANEATGEVDQATSALEDATQQSTEAQQALDQATDAYEQAQNGPQATMITFDLTHCDTCDPVDTFEIGGELFFDVVWVAGLDLSLGWGNGQFDSIEGEFSIGVQKQFTWGGKHIGIWASASGTLTLTVGYEFDGGGWFELDIDLELQASLDLYISILWFSHQVTLLAVQLEAGLEILPTPVSWSGSASIDVIGWTFSVSVGPEPF